MREMWSQQAVEPRARHRCQHRHQEDRRSAADQRDQWAGTRTGERPAEAEDRTTDPITAPRSEGLGRDRRSEEHTSELQSQSNLVCRLLLEKKKKNQTN